MLDNSDQHPSLQHLCKRNTLKSFIMETWRFVPDHFFWKNVTPKKIFFPVEKPKMWFHRHKKAAMSNFKYVFHSAPSFTNDELFFINQSFLHIQANHISLYTSNFFRIMHISILTNVFKQFLMCHIPLLNIPQYKKLLCQILNMCSISYHLSQWMSYCYMHI